MDDSDAVDATQDTPQPERRLNAIRPVTIRQLVSNTKIRKELTRTRPLSRYSLDGDDFSIVDSATFVGNIISVEASGETTRTIRIEDGTGKITSTYLIKEAEEMEDPPRWRVRAYARVFGVPRLFNEVMKFDIYSIRLVEDPHEVLFHLMEAIAVTLQLSRGQPPPKLLDSTFASISGPPLPSQSQSLPVPSTSQAADHLGGESQASVTAMPSYSPKEDSNEVNDDGGGSTDYYSDQPPDSPLERSPSPTPVAPFARNRSYEGHSDREEGPSSQSTQRPNVRFSDDDDDDVVVVGDGRTPRGRSKLPKRGDSGSKSPKKSSDDEELEFLRSELSSSQIIPSTPPRLKPDPYSGWSPAKRKIMIFVRSKTPGEELNIKRNMGEGMSKIEMRHAIRELVKEGEIETVDGMNYRLTDKGPNYPRF